VVVKNMSIFATVSVAEGKLEILSSPTLQSLISDLACRRTIKLEMNEGLPRIEQLLDGWTPERV
jgi:hypothetical protein